MTVPTKAEWRGAIYALFAVVALVMPFVTYAQETISLPFRSSDIPKNSYWVVSEFSEGCCTLDLNVHRWDGNNWKKRSGSSTNSQHYDWNVPLYAPASGVIASCWRNFPDDPSPGVNPPNNNIFGGGNHVVIITDAGNAISLNHFREGTIPAKLCPPNMGTHQYPSTTAKQESWRVDAYIEQRDRPRVTEGDYLGRVGNSGNSGSPHLHISLTKITGTDSFNREKLATNSSPLKFRHAWGHEYEETQKDTSGGWYHLRGGDFTGDPACSTYQPNSPSCGFKMIHASPYLRRASVSAGSIEDVDIVFISSQRAVTATIGANNNLKLIAWDLVGVDTIKRRGEINVGTIKDFAVAKPTPNHVLVAVRQNNNNLKLIAHHVMPDGRFRRVAHATAGKISALEMTTTSGDDPKAVTAVRDENGNLKIIVWDIQLANDGTASVVRLGQASAGAVSALAISRTSNFNGVYTAVRASNESLKVIPWKLSADGVTVARGNAGSAGSIGTKIAVAPLVQGVAVAVRDEQDKLRVITWSASSNGDIGARRGTGIAGDISDVTSIVTPHAASNLTTVVRDSNGDLRLIGWGINDNGANVRRLGSSKAGRATSIAIDGISRSYPGLDPRDMILTAIKDKEGKLKLITWDTSLNNP